MKAKETLLSILDHFVILLCLIATDFALKAILHFQFFSDSIGTANLNQILTYFLIGAVLVFTIFAFVQLTLHAFKSTKDLLSELFPKSPNQEVAPSKVLDGEGK